MYRTPFFHAASGAGDFQSQQTEYFAFDQFTASVMYVGGQQEDSFRGIKCCTC